MDIERKLARFITEVNAADIPDTVGVIAKDVLLTVCGTAIAGAKQDGIASLREILTSQGGQPEATTFVFGDRLPAANAALLNGAMSRALDYCDAMKPGLHLGSSVVPAALAAAELTGSCTGEKFLTALVAGLETGARLNLTEVMYNGFDPTGIAGLMGATAAVARVFSLSEEQTLHALALAFNRCGGSFQSNIDGSLAVRLIQGWVAETAMQCAKFAKAELTGPVNFLSGIYGYAHLFARDMNYAHSFTAGIGIEYRLLDMVFKKFPSCGLTQGVTELALRTAEKYDLHPEVIDKIEIHLPSYAYRLVGHPFVFGDNPRVNAQFSAQYCVANAIVRGESRLHHFEPETISDPSVVSLMSRTFVTHESGLDQFDHTAARLAVTTSGGGIWVESLDIAPGFPGNPLTAKDQVKRFDDCLFYSGWQSLAERSKPLQALVAHIEEERDVRTLVQSLLAEPERKI